MFIPFDLSVQFVPFYFVIDSFKSGYVARAYIENFILLLPLGLYVPLLFERFGKAQITIFMAFLVSTSIETLQLMIGLTVGSYRTFNVDDITLNIAGPSIGYYTFLTCFLSL